MLIDYTWFAGAVWALFCGWALSSYASNFIFRFPRKEYPFGRTPYCGDCNSELTPRDLAPIISYYRTDGKCRHCGSQVPLSYFILELILPLLFLFSYAQYQFGDAFILAATTSCTLIVIAMLGWEDEYYSPLTTTFLAFMGLLMQVLQTQDLMGGLLSGLTAFLLAAAWHLRNMPKAVVAPDIRQFPSYVWLATAMGCWLPLIPFCMAAFFWFIITKALRFIFCSTQNKTYAIQAIAFSITMIIAIFSFYP